MGERTSDLIKAAFRWVDGHADIWEVLGKPTVLRRVGREMARPFADAEITAVLALESRGFVLGPLVALELDARFVPVRKREGLLPGPKLVRTASRDYRGHIHELRIQRDSLNAGARVLLVDDWAETGNQLVAAAEMVLEGGASVVGTSLLVNEMSAPPAVLGRVHALVHADDLEKADGETRQ